MKIIIAPDSFKGSLTASEAAEAIAAGIRRVYPNAELVLLPLADGGEGTVSALVTATQGTVHRVTVSGPLSEPVEAIWGFLGGPEQTAVVEMASAAGLLLVPDAQRDPRQTTTFGVGELILHTAQSGARSLIIGLGGSATNDGGAGALQAMGVTFYDDRGKLLPTGISGRDLRHIARIDAGGIVPSLRRLKTLIASDVTNPLCGSDGASAVYGPQKGATPSIVAELDAGLAHYAALLKRDLGKDVAPLPGAGAAGGLGTGLMAVLDATLHSGTDLILDTARFSEKLPGADFVFTGEGRIDAQTLHGKTVSGVLKRCRQFGSVPVVAFAGSVDREAAAALDLSAAIAISEGLPTDQAMRSAGSLLSRAVERYFT